MFIDEMVMYFIYFLIAFGVYSFMEALYLNYRNRTDKVNELKSSKTKQIELPHISADILTTLCQDDKFHSLVFDEHGVHLVINE